MSVTTQDNGKPFPANHYINKCFLFKNDKYRKYFKQFDKEKKYVQYYSIYVISIIIQFATYYILIKSI